MKNVESTVHKKVAPHRPPRKPQYGHRERQPPDRPATPRSLLDPNTGDPEEICQEVGIHLTHARQAAGLTQSALAAQMREHGCPVSQSFLSWVEHGGTLSWDRFAVLCFVLGSRPSRIVALAEGNSHAKTSPEDKEIPNEGVDRHDALLSESSTVTRRPAWLQLSRHLGPAIRITRLRGSGVTQAKLASAIKGRLDVTYINAVEKGRTNVSWPRFLDFCRALRCRPSEILFTAEERAILHVDPSPPDIRQAVEEVNQRLANTPAGADRVFLLMVKADLERRLSQ